MCSASKYWLRKQSAVSEVANQTNLPSSALMASSLCVWSSSSGVRLDFSCWGSAWNLPHTWLTIFILSFIIYGGVLILDICTCIMTDVLSTHRQVNKKVKNLKVEYLRGNNFFAAKEGKRREKMLTNVLKFLFQGCRIRERRSLLALTVIFYFRTFKCSFRGWKRKIKMWISFNQISINNKLR